MKATRNWTTPADLRQQVHRLWDRGTILASIVSGDPLFPKRLSIKGPTSAQLHDGFNDARSWAADLRAMRGFRLEEKKSRHRLFGDNALPCAAWLDSIENVVSILGKVRDRARFEELVATTRVRQPALIAWICKRPLIALNHADDWERCLDVVGWLQVHPQPGIYLRQMDIPGVHTKFVEAHRTVLAELLDIALPAFAIDHAATGVNHFGQRYGFLTRPNRVRFRFLDPVLKRETGIVGQDITLDANSFAILNLPVSQVFICENEINFLTLPKTPRAMVIFGAGYGFDALSLARWLNGCRLHYWGDIDTHGFAILDQLRAHFPHAESFLMDRATLFACKPFWGCEKTPENRHLPHLNTAESKLYDELRDDRHGQQLRLEQEHIGFGWVEQALCRLAE
ncbi:MAG: DUF2220 family protein [Gammaproteobacteria bacterium]|nr:DUF2220 family protein [Gammaproteobacteria bacterium]